MKTKLSILLCFTILCLYSSSALKITHDFDQDVCLLRSAPRGQFKEMTKIEYCEEKNMTLANSVCSKCKPGFISLPGTIGICTEPCPEGWTYAWPRCFNRKGLDYSYRSRSDCEENHGECDYADTLSKYLPNCVGGEYFENAKWCNAKWHYSIDTQAKFRLGCKDGFEQVNNLCYPTCPAGMQAYDDVCREKCPKGYTQCGSVCAWGKSCGNVQVKNLEVFIEEVKQVAAKRLTGVELDFSRLICS